MSQVVSLAQENGNELVQAQKAQKLDPCLAGVCCLSRLHRCIWQLICFRTVMPVHRVRCHLPSCIQPLRNYTV